MTTTYAIETNGNELTTLLPGQFDPTDPTHFTITTEAAATCEQLLNRDPAVISYTELNESYRDYTINIYRSDDEWCYSAESVERGFDHSDTIGVENNATEAEATAAIEMIFPGTKISKIEDITHPVSYLARMDGAETKLDATDINSARDGAREWAADGSWDTSDGTIWVDVYLISVQDGEEIDSESLTIQIDPEEPKCTESEHDWQAPYEIVGGIRENPGVWGHGGGVIIHAVCMHCGCERVTDMWAQRHDTGEQGLTSVKYEPGKYADQVAALADDES